MAFKSLSQHSDPPPGSVRAHITLKVRLRRGDGRWLPFCDSAPNFLEDW